MTDPIDTRRELLRITLQAAVPFWILKLKRRPREETIGRAHELAQVIAEKGDVIQFKGKTKGETAAAFNALAEGLACCSFAPGGITFMGDHWETP